MKKKIIAIAMLATVTFSSFAVLAGCGTPEYRQMEKQLEEVREKTEKTAGAYLKKVEEANQKSQEIRQQYNNYELLLNELLRITDANGKIIYGYEQRASEIAETLSDGLDIDIRIINNTVVYIDKSYD